MNKNILVLLAMAMTFSCAAKEDDNLLKYEDEKDNTEEPEDLTPPEGEIGPWNDGDWWDGSGWVKVEELSDEFNAAEIDFDKWRNSCGAGGWGGRGSDYRRDNTFVDGEGLLHLKASIIGTDEQFKELYQEIEKTYCGNEDMIMGDKLDPRKWDPWNYGEGGWNATWGGDNYDKIMELGTKTIGAATLISKRLGSYGYYESRFKVSNFCMSSAFWLQGPHTIEFDITESIGKCNHNTTIERFVEGPKKITTSVWVNVDGFAGKGGIDPQHYYHREPLCEDFVVLGILWDKEKLTVYVNHKEAYSFSLLDRKTNTDKTPIPNEFFKNSYNRYKSYLL